MEPERIQVSKYLELKSQAEALLQQAEVAREQEINEAVARIKQEMTSLGLTLVDLRHAGIADPQQAKHKTKVQPTPAKYRGPNGELWSGGRGRRPDWVLKALKDGKSLEEFALQRH